MKRRAAAVLIFVTALLLPLVLPVGSAIGASQPWISGTSPANGPAEGGTVVGINGAAFVSGASVTFGGVASPTVTFVDSGHLLATTPPGTPGVVTVTVTNPDGQSRSISAGFTYNTAAPPISVTVITPSSGATVGGTVVSIAGTGFVTGTTVMFGGYAATGVSVLSSGLIIATTPFGPVGAVNVVLTTPAGATTTFPGFAYGTATGTTNPNQPSVTAVSPASGPIAGGTQVSITGSGFVSPATVTFGGVAATSVVVVDSTRITATTPPNSAGLVTVLVGVPGGAVGGLTGAFTYMFAAPLVTSIVPASGPANGGTAITINGTGFLTGATVSVGGMAATSVVVASATQITAFTPPGSGGPAVVLVTNPGGSISGLASGFAYSGGATTPPPSSTPSPTPSPTPSSLTVAAVSPSTGPLTGGTSITISGTGFASGAVVTIGSSVTSSTVISPTQIVSTTPPAAVAGTVAVMVTNPGADSASLPGAFTYVAAPASPPPSSGGTTFTGGSGLFVFAGGSNADLLTASGCSASTAVFWTTDAQGVWVGYIPSAPVAIVNASWNALFPNGIPGGTPIFARCQ